MLKKRKGENKMPKNYFENRPRYSHYPSCILPGDKVMIVTKDKQGTRRVEDLVTGIVVRVLSRGKYYRNGVKVEILPMDLSWPPLELAQKVHEIQEAPDAKALPFVQEELLVIGRIQYILR